MRSLKPLFPLWVSWLEKMLQFGSTKKDGEVTFSAPYELPASELVARFIYSDKRMSKLHARPRPDAFYPPDDDELSVVHSTGLPDNDVWEIGRQHTLDSQHGRDKIVGRADVPVYALIDRKLRAKRDDDPFERHTSVIGWPESSIPAERKQQRKQICLELSQDPSVKLIIPETPIIRS